MHKHILLIISIGVSPPLGLEFIILSVWPAGHPAWVDTQHTRVEIPQLLPQCS